METLLTKLEKWKADWESLNTEKYLPKKWLPYMGYITLIPAIGFLYLYFTNSRLNAGEGGGKTWWHNFRIIHGMLYLLFSILIIPSLVNN